MMIIAFGSQALISLLLSVAARFLLSDLSQLTEIELGLDLDKLAAHYPKRVNQTGIKDILLHLWEGVYVDRFLTNTGN